jgi:hypothetical protein
VSELMKRGTFLLSIDTELAWGGIHNQQFHHRRSMFEITREIITRLLALHEKYEIHSTWAVVGHLFLDRCKPVDGVKHPELVRPDYSWFSGDWFQYDPCTSMTADPFWYGPDIVEEILKCRTPQEIGCHGFSHVITGDPGCSRECFDSELKACQEVATLWGINLKSFVYPRNSIGHVDVLAENGYTNFRGVVSSSWRQGLPWPMRKAVSGMDNVFPVPPLVAAPQESSGIWDLPGTCFYLHRDGWARNVPISLRVQKAKIGVKQAISSKSIFHLWFHPFNIASDPNGLLDGLESIFKEVAEFREQGLLDNPTMEGLAGELDVLTAERKAIA